MKKNIYALVMFGLGASVIQAKPVTPTTAKNVAANYYKQHSAKVPQRLTLAYTAASATTGEALIYAYNVNDNDGFVLVAADDAAHPIIGYSDKNQFVEPSAKVNPNFNFWLEVKKEELLFIKQHNLAADAEISNEWAGSFSSQRLANGVGSVASATVAALVQSDWNQSPYYNADCPGATTGGTNSAACVTGCVATTMSQIMRYWSYPAHGTGSHSYTAGSYGTLSANFGATTYNWAGMPLNDNNITGTASTYSAVALVMSQAGISVEMSYSPSGSGAFVLASDVGAGGACAQQSYTLYFGYNPSTIKGYNRTSGGISDANWINYIETDLLAGRPVQYAGQDPSQGGHTWVCDGFDATNKVHMNWGWAGSDDGFFDLTTSNGLLTTNGGFDPQNGQQILVGIQPPASVDAGISAIAGATGVVCSSTVSPVVTISNFGVNTLTVSTINYKIDAGTNQTYTWTGSLSTGGTATVALPAVTISAGTHTLTSSTSSPNHGTDSNTSNDATTSTFANGSVGSTLPLMEGFESSSTNLPAGWSVANTSGNPAWTVSSSYAHTGTNSIIIDNFAGNSDGSTSAGEISWFYTGSYNLSTAGTYSMSFDVAYADLGQYTDSLAVYASTNCGSTWSKVYQKGGVTLATGSGGSTTNVSTAWTPTASAQWRTDNVNLSSYAGHSGVMFGFKNISAWGEPIYLDNINIHITSTTGISSNVSTVGFNMYPNPASGSFTVEGDDHTGNIGYVMFNMTGQEVKTGTISTNGNSFKEVVSTNGLASGMYFIRISDEKNTWTKKISVQ